MGMFTIRRRRDFLAARSGERVGTTGFLLLKSAGSAGPDHIRAGFTVTRKLGGAVLRNRIRRRLKEAARAVLPTAGEAGFDYVFIARPAALNRKFDDLLDDVKRALLRLSSHPK